MRKMARDYEIVGLDAVLSGNLPRRALLITFDDGYRSFVDVALPVLRRLGLPSVLFVTGACLEPYSLPLDNLLSYLCATVGLERPGERRSTLPRARPAHVPASSSTMVASMPYEPAPGVGDELAERFEVDQASSEPRAGIFLDAQDLAGLAAGWMRGREPHSQLTSSAGRSSTRRPPTMRLVEHARRLESLTGHPVRAFSFPYGRREDATPMVERVLRESGHEASVPGGVTTRSDREASAGSGTESRWTAARRGGSAPSSS